MNLAGGFSIAQAQVLAQEKTQEEVDVERFKQADTNDDGAVTRNEFRAYLSAVKSLEWFTKYDEFMNRLDTDQNNKISLEEFALRQKVLRMMVAEEQAKEMENEPKEFADMFNARFLPNKPTVGSIVSGDLMAYDENGDEIQFKDFRGKYTVINFGCLT